MLQQTNKYTCITAERKWCRDETKWQNSQDARSVNFMHPFTTPTPHFLDRSPVSAKLGHVTHALYSEGVSFAPAKAQQNRLSKQHSCIVRRLDVKQSCSILTERIYYVSPHVYVLWFLLFNYVSEVPHVTPNHSTLPAARTYERCAAG